MGAQLNPGSPRCLCSVCGEMFMTHVAFDRHRGIVASDDELHQDPGVCLGLGELGLTQVDGLWCTPEEHAVYLKYQAMREAR